MFCWAEQEEGQADVDRPVELTKHGSLGANMLSGDRGQKVTTLCKRKSLTLHEKFFTEQAETVD